MALKITNNSFLSKHFISVDSGGVQFCEPSSLGTRRFSFDRIECVLMSPDHKLSFQVGKEVFTIQTKPDDAKHQEVINALLQEVQRSAGRAA